MMVPLTTLRWYRFSAIGNYISEIEPMIIAYPTDKKGIDDFNNIMSSFESKIEIENKYLQSLLIQKVYLLSNMFI